MGSTNAILNGLSFMSTDLLHLVTVIAGNGSFDGNLNGGGGVGTGGNNTN